jgi:hypothetical protein
MFGDRDRIWEVAIVTMRAILGLRLNNFNFNLYSRLPQPFYQHLSQSSRWSQNMNSSIVSHSRRRWLIFNMKTNNENKDEFG